MHAGQVDVPAGVVARLVAEQFPAWRGLPVRPVVSAGTVNALFRVGEDVVARLPLRPAADAGQRAALLHEQAAARLLAPHLPVAVPEPLGLGEPGRGYPGLWSVHRWIPGEPADPDALDDPERLATDLAAVILALRAVDTGGRRWDGHSRGGPLAARDDGVRRALAASAGLADVARLTAVWERCLRAPVHPGPARWLHADLMPGNLLLRHGRPAAVIDLGTVCVGDPAVDLMPAWNLLPAPARATFRQALAPDAADDADAAWERGRGWALAQAAPALPYYTETNPQMAATARRTLQALLADRTPP